MTDPSIYRSKHPEVLATVQKWKDDNDAFRKAVKAFKRRFKLGKREAMVTTGFGRKKLMGFSCLDGDWRDPPAGWRYMGQDHMIVPYRNKAKGDPEIVKAFEAIAPVMEYRATWPGMPQHTGFFRQPGAHFDAAEEYMYCDWGDEHGPPAGEVDLTYWEPVLRSEYHRMKEAGEFERAEDKETADA